MWIFRLLPVKDLCREILILAGTRWLLPTRYTARGTRSPLCMNNLDSAVLNKEFVKIGATRDGSSFRHCALGEIGTVELESFWTAARREAVSDPRSQKRDLGHPSV